MYVCVCIHVSVQMCVYVCLCTCANVCACRCIRECVNACFPVYRRVRQMEKKLVSTESRLAPVRERFSNYSSKLADAKDLLQKAMGTVRQTVGKNRDNFLKFLNSEVTVRMS